MNEGIDFPGYPPKPVVQRLAISRFDAAKRAWLEAETADEDVCLPKLTCTTFNTWFQGGERELRYGGLLSALQRSDADVIVLQEVTTLLLEMIQAADWIRSSYRFARAPFRSNAIPSHGVMLLSRLPLRHATLHPIPTHMGRSLLTAECRINGTRFVFATAHLESMKPNADVRAEQLRAIFAVLEDAQDAVLAGDFNFCSSWTEENDRIDRRYGDAWAALHPGEPGFTQDTDINRMLAQAKRETKRLRIDRILLRSDAGHGRWTPESVRLIGAEPVSLDHPRIFPSDHFGVTATFRSSH
jgi:tyrosyl-DNA phosphodiesterase 2